MSEVRQLSFDDIVPESEDEVEARIIERIRRREEELREMVLRRELRPDPKPPIPLSPRPPGWSLEYFRRQHQEYLRSLMWADPTTLYDPKEIVLYCKLWGLDLTEFEKQVLAQRFLESSSDM